MSTTFTLFSGSTKFLYLYEGGTSKFVETECVCKRIEQPLTNNKHYPKKIAKPLKNQ